MKSSVFIKLFFILPVVIFGEYMLMIIFGCVSSMFNPDEDFYCGPFCIVGKIILVLTVFLSGFYLFPEVRAFIKSHKNGQTSKVQENK